MLDMMDPLYDKKSNFVGWLIEYRNVFDKNLKWVAYINIDFVWAKKTRVWIGGLRGTNLVDRDGGIVAWSISGPVVGGIEIIKAPLDVGPPFLAVIPIIHEVPFNPGYAPEPAGEWSKLTFTQWLHQR